MSEIGIDTPTLVEEQSLAEKHGNPASVQNKTLLWNEQLKSIDF